MTVMEWDGVETGQGGEGGFEERRGIGMY